MYNLAVVHEKLHEVCCVQYAEKAIGAYEEYSDDEGVAKSQAQLALCLLLTLGPYQHDNEAIFDKVERCCRRAVKRAELHNLTEMQCDALINMAQVLVTRKKYNEAFDVNKRIVKLARRRPYCALETAQHNLKTIQVI